MEYILAQINQWIKQFLIGCINGNLSGLFDTVNAKVGEIAADVGKAPADWNIGVLSMIRSVSDTVIVPIAGMILAFVLTYELIQMLTDRNNLHDIDSWIFFKWAFKSLIAIYLLTHTFEMVLAVFDVAQHVVEGSVGVIHGTTQIDVTAAIGSLTASLEEMENAELFGLCMETLLIRFTMNIMSWCIFIIIYGRMIEIFLCCSIGPIPMATMTNRDWGQMGQNYMRTLFALGFQGFLILVCVGIYAVLVQAIPTAANLHTAIWTVAGYTVLLCFSLFQTGSLAKTFFNAH
jgi:hypothetical protein